MGMARHRSSGHRRYQLVSALRYAGMAHLLHQAMSSFDHTALIQSINEGIVPLKKSQPEAMQGFGQLARAAMTEGSISAKHKELMALAIGITQHCSGCIGFHVKALQKLQCTRVELDEMLSVCVYMGGGPALMYAAETVKAWDAMAAA